jgi:exopolyphosphatase/guanosine-5'-triphosphate,3'-diphosphate pyrophosphatase
VRAVGTSTLRQAKDARRFLAQAEKALGHPIEVISGQEEARLVYVGVTQSVSGLPPRRLVVDIGGGSTECILGRGPEILLAESLHMGCVSYSRRFFPDGRIDATRMEAAEVAAALELRPIRYRFRDAGWEVALGSSGTIEAIDELVRAGETGGPHITPKGIRGLRKAIVESGRVDKLALPGLSQERASVLPGGFAILAAVFESLKVERMTPARGALREGALYDLIGRLQEGDVRHASVRGLARRASVDEAQAARVRDTALALYDQVAAEWGLAGPRGRLYLGWAAELHEVGLSFAHSGYHKHGAYLVRHADLAGFSKEGQLLLATLIRTHRGKLVATSFNELPEEDRKLARKLTVLLRLAVRLRRNRSERALPALTLSAKKGRVTLSFPEGFLARHPLTLEDLHDEARRLASLEIELAVL